MLEVRIRSALEKIFLDSRDTAPDFDRGSALLGERFAFQLSLKHDGWGRAEALLRVDSPLKERLRLYRVGNVPCELPAYPDACDEDYLTTAPGLFPDPLFPLCEDRVEISGFSRTALWVEVDIPRELPAGEYPISFTVSCGEDREERTFFLTVIGRELPPQKLIYTQWFHGDCIAEHYQVPVYSEAHWRLLESYLKGAHEDGVNMVLTPVLTPALDTEVGGERPCTQLLGVEKEGESYRFDFSLLERFLELAQACGIGNFEISHLYTQWGAKAAPSIYGVERGERKRLFGWETPAAGPAYRSFLRQLLPRLTDFLRKKGLENRVIFHISDEPEEEQLASYLDAKEGAVPFLSGFPVYDALSGYQFLERGAVEHPIASTDHIEPFLEHHTPGLWAYYCCAQNRRVGNRFFAMPSYRNRILGTQLYRFGISGFLHWGYNFWYTQNSRAKIDPYRVTDAGRAFPGGDAFSVYPGKQGPIPSIRGRVFYHGLQDMRALSLLESLMGREKVLSLLEREGPITFSHYPRSARWLLDAREEANRLIGEKL